MDNTHLPPISRRGVDAATRHSIARELSAIFGAELKLRSRLGRYRIYYGDEFIPEGGQVV